MSESRYQFRTFEIARPLKLILTSHWKILTLTKQNKLLVQCVNQKVNDSFCETLSLVPLQSVIVRVNKKTTATKRILSGALKSCQNHVWSLQEEAYAKRCGMYTLGHFHSKGSKKMFDLILEQVKLCFSLNN